MKFAIALASSSFLLLHVAKISADSPPAPRFTCPAHQVPVCVGGDGEYVTTLRNECKFAEFAAETDGMVNRILHRGVCNRFGDQQKWSGWERDEDDIPADYDEYKLRNPDSKY